MSQNNEPGMSQFKWWVPRNVYLPKQTHSDLTLPEPKDFEASRKKLEKLSYKCIWSIVFKQDTAV